MAKAEMEGETEGRVEIVGQLTCLMMRGGLGVLEALGILRYGFYIPSIFTISYHHLFKILNLCLSSDLLLQALLLLLAFPTVGL